MTKIELRKKGIEIFGSWYKYAKWLGNYNKALNSKPIDLVNTEKGRNLLLVELGRIEHGILA